MQICILQKGSVITFKFYWLFQSKVSFRTMSTLCSSELVDLRLACRLLRFSSASILRTLSTNPSSLINFSLSRVQKLSIRYSLGKVLNVS